MYVYASSLKMGKNGLDTRDSDTGTGLLLNVSDLVVVNNDCISSSSLSQALFRQIDSLANGLGEGRIAITSKDELVSTTEGLTPRRLHKRVIGTDNNHVINALCLDLVNLLNERRDVVCSAGRGESAGDEDNNDLLVGELLGGDVGRGDAAGGDVGVLGLIWDVGELDVLGEGV